MALSKNKVLTNPIWFIVIFPLLQELGGIRHFQTNPNVAADLFWAPEK